MSKSDVWVFWKGFLKANEKKKQDKNEEQNFADGPRDKYWERKLKG